jgi:2-amino-4-hydroxy-6-hydroxymethyldihydropteridine diphosphokinase
VRVVASSSVYETEPVGLVREQRDFLNACVLIETEHGPEQLLEACKQVELEVGRSSGGERHGPREIDVDLLLLDSLEHRSERLALPHPELRTRRFVLIPLLELEPELALPSGERLADAIAAVEGQAVRRVSGPLI